MNEDQKFELVLLLGETLENGYMISYVMETVVPKEFNFTENQIKEMTVIMREFSAEQSRDYIKLEKEIYKILE